ncbi:ABC transporter permease [Streptomyces sp. NPDC000594]|uniref:ABC transporter permease n=1 Tax=Streptomyces sp. NPDC000594 TaxID=3154261 RepID=UPI00332704A4
MLVLANIRERWSSLLAAFVAVGVGVTLITTTLVIHDSARPVPQKRLAAAPVLILPEQARDQDGRDADRVPWSAERADGLRRELNALPGVARAVADRSFYAQMFDGDRPVADAAAEEAGHGWSSAALAPYRLVDGAAPAGPREIVVDRGLGPAVGERISVNLAAGRAEFQVVGTVDGPGLYFTDAVARTQRPGVSVLALVPEKGASVSAVASGAGKAVDGDGTVLTGDERSAVQPAHIEHRRFLGTQLIAAMATLALFTTGFVVASMLVLATGARRREIGLLRMIGADPRQIRRMVLGEAAAVGALGSLVGCVAGVLLSPLLREWLLRLDVAPPELELRFAARPLLAATAVGVGVSLLGAWAAGRTAARVAPLEALLDGGNDNRAMGRGRWIAGLALLGLGVLGVVLTAVARSDARINTAVVATMTLIAAAALLAPVLIVPVTRAITAPFSRGTSAVPMLIRADMSAGVGRAASLAAPVIAAVGFAVLLSGAVETMRVAYPAGEAQRLRGEAIVTPKGTPGHSDEIVAATPPGRSSLLSRAFVERGDGTPAVVDALGSQDPRWDVPGEAVLGRSLADFLGVRAGENHPVTMADGTTVTVRISRVLADDPARGDFVLPRDLVREHDPAALTGDIFVPEEQRPANALPGTAVHDAVAYALEDYGTDARLTDRLALMLILIGVGYSAVAVANSMAMAAHARRRDFAVMKSAGGTRGQLLCFAVGETALVVAVGAGLGLLVALPPLAGMAAGFSDATGTDVGLHLSGPVVVGASVGCLVLATGASALVTWWTMRRGAA